MIKRTALLAGALLLTACCDKEQQRVDALHNKVVESGYLTYTPPAQRGRINISLPSLRLCVQVSGLMSGDSTWLRDGDHLPNPLRPDDFSVVWPDAVRMDKLGWAFWSEEFQELGPDGNQGRCTTYIPLKAKEFLTK